MAVNQSQVDHIITAASEDDPEVKLQNLEREVDLIKTSIKRLLMDIRERMNELENPFTLSAGAGSESAPSASSASAIGSEVNDAKSSALEAREAALDARESQLDATKAKMDSEPKKTSSPPAKEESPAPAASDERKTLDDQMLSALKAQMSQTYKMPQVPATAPAPAQQNEKLRLQKVYKLFKWTHQSVKKFGHDRLEIMLESYRVMGYIPKESADEIREISRLMPANLGEEHEVGPDEFVAELYALNRILAPNDTSLDRDMIEVMMEQRQQEGLVPERKSDERIDLSTMALNEKKSSSKNKEKDEEWMNLPDRI
ncbi:MAG: hypothetical protein WC586_05900 [Methanoregula sp.]